MSQSFYQFKLYFITEKLICLNSEQNNRNNSDRSSGIIKVKKYFLINILLSCSIYLFKYNDLFVPKLITTAKL